MSIKQCKSNQTLDDVRLGEQTEHKYNAVNAQKFFSFPYLLTTSAATAASQGEVHRRWRSL